MTDTNDIQQRLSKLQALGSELRLYFVGIGGIGMSALARYAKYQGHDVAGYDLTESELTKKLVSEGIDVHYTDNVNLIPKVTTPENTLVVRTPAVPSSHSELNYFYDNGYVVAKRSELLGFLTRNSKCVAVAGTHGKTSTSTMATLQLHEAGIDAAAFLGGISRNFESNLVLSKDKNAPVVVEADEFDRSFLQLTPSIAVITAMDADHLDIYGTHENLIEAFGQFIGKVKSGGVVLAKKSLDVSKFVNENQKLYTYSITQYANFCTKSIRVEDGAYHFDMITPFGEITDIKFTYPGRVNIENMVAATAVALICGADKNLVKKGFLEYRGVQRRFDVRFSNSKKIYIDDYAHHPEELRATIESARELYAGKKILGIFQPHLYSRTRDLADGFAQSLDLLDEAVVLDIYPARELPIPGITSQTIIDKMTTAKHRSASLSDFPEILASLDFDILLTLGAGNIDRLVPVIESWMKENCNDK